MNTSKDIKTIFAQYISKLNNAVKDLKPDTYTNHLDHTSHECPGAYSAAMTNSMIFDMQTLALLLYKTCPEATNTLFTVSEAFAKKDLTLRTMFDQINSELPLVQYDFSTSEPLINQLADIKDLQELKSEPFNYYKEKFKAWVEKLVKIDIWAFYLTSQELLNKFDDYEPTEAAGEHSGFIKLCALTNKTLLEYLIKLPVCTDLEDDCLSRIETNNWLIDAYITGNYEALDNLYRYASAVADFSEGA